MWKKKIFVALLLDDKEGKNTLLFGNLYAWRRRKIATNYLVIN